MATWSATRCFIARLEVKEVHVVYKVVHTPVRTPHLPVDRVFKLDGRVSCEVAELPKVRSLANLHKARRRCREGGRWSVEHQLEKGEIYARHEGDLALAKKKHAPHVDGTSQAAKKRSARLFLHRFQPSRPDAGKPTHVPQQA